jgi:hypothetical protein
LAGQCLDYSDDNSSSLLPGAHVNSTIKFFSSSGLAGTEQAASTAGAVDRQQVQLETEYSGQYNASTYGASNNLCIDGRIAPSFFLLGAQKSATTNFFYRLIDVALSFVPPHDDQSFYKEFHVFDSASAYQNMGRDGWLKYYPKCTQKVYSIGMDASPAYISSPGAPARMHAWYGPALGGRVNFLVLLREPLARMHSSFYHGKQWAYKDITLVDYVTKALANNRLGCPTGKVYPSDLATKACVDPDNMPLGDPFYLSLYAAQLDRWLKVFPAKQFTVAPFLTYVAPKPGVPSLLEYIAVKKLGSAIKQDAQLVAFSKKEHGAGKSMPNPPLDVDLSNLPFAAQRELQAVVDAHAGPEALAHVLMPRMQQGLTLFGYSQSLAKDLGTYGADSVSGWIRSNW